MSRDILRAASAGGSPATRFPRRAACRARARHCCCPAASAPCHSGLSPSAWGKQRPRRRELPLQAPPERCA